MSRYKKKELKLPKSCSYKAQQIFFLCVFLSKTRSSVGKLVCLVIWKSFEQCQQEKVAKDFTQDKNDLAALYIFFFFYFGPSKPTNVDVSEDGYANRLTICIH